jgi:hypothetical protein
MMLFFGIVVGPDRFGDINNGALPVGITAPYPKFNHDFIRMFMIVVCPNRFGDINNGALPVGITAPYPKFNRDFIRIFDRIKTTTICRVCCPNGQRTVV